ncbi:MAG: thiamine pyrophosphate-dependent enzyme, partial [Candidatus Bathyarchaeia archaeon]
MELKAMYTDNIPVVLIIGQNRTHEEEIYGGAPGPHYLSFTEVGGQQRLVDAYVKWSDAPDSNANVLSIFSRAFEITSSDVKGPVLISISRELLFEKVKKMRIPPSSSPTPIQADPRALEKLSELLVKSKLPIIYTRYLGRSLTAVGSLVELTDILAAPVFETPGYMNFPTNHPMHLGYSIYPYASEADLILVIDASGWPPWYPPSSILRRSDAKIVFIDLDPLQIKYSIYNYPSHMLIKADSSLALSSLVKLVKEKISNTKIADEIESRRKTFSLKHREIREEWRREALKVEGDTPIDARWLCHCINEAIDENTLIVHETISYGEPVHRLVEKNRIIPGTWFEAAGPVAHTGLGQGLGVAMGLKLARPDKTVIALDGDGAFNYNPVTASYGLAQEYSLPFLTVIFNNQSYASMKNHLKFYPEGWSARTGTFYGVYFKTKPNYAKIAEAFDGYSEVVENPQDVKPALMR